MLVGGNVGTLGAPRRGPYRPPMPKRLRAFLFEELDEVTRRWMLAEFRLEQSRRDLPPYRPRRISPAGMRVFADVMESALAGGDETDLAAALSAPELWRVPDGGTGDEAARIARQYAERFAFTEFNTWYVRGLSRRLLEEGVPLCEVYRAAPSYRPRGECGSLEGRRLAVAEVYAAHRARYHPVADPEAVSIPFGPNCRHSIRRVRSDGR